jgi:hypothetical protein
VLDPADSKGSVSASSSTEPQSVEDRGRRIGADVSFC